MHFFGFGLLSFSVFFGSLYTARISSFFFRDFFTGLAAKIRGVHESDLRILFPFLVLSFLSVFVGFFVEPLFKDEYSSIWLGGRFLAHANYSLAFGEYSGHSAFFRTYGQVLSDEDLCFLIENVSAFGTFFAVYIYTVGVSFLMPVRFSALGVSSPIRYQADALGSFYGYTEKRSMTDRIYNKVFSFAEFRNAKVYFFDYFERGFLEWAGPTGLVRLVNFLAEFFSSFTSGLIHDYLFFSWHLPFCLYLFSSEAFPFPCFSPSCSSSWCPHCAAAKMFFGRTNVTAI